MKLQRYGQDGKPRNEIKEMPEGEYQAYVNRTRDQTWRPVKMQSRKPVIDQPKLAKSTIGNKLSPTLKK